ncbi:MAG: MFS transporter [Chroococcidiopsidaceae cyanobacterium CP_BM_ER_R8_30]|nr:MFS transporter [Chroococcidiopsidaceae cyanobacterium CP_BM_ER_R8_30]
MKNWYWQLGNQVNQTIYRHLPAFKWRNFRLFFGGQLLSMSGTFMTQQLTIPWLTYKLTHSAWLLGLAGFLQFLPTLLLIPFSGVLADRWSRRDLLMLVQVVGISISITLTILTFLDMITFPSLLLLSVLNGMLKGLDMPLRHTIVTETVEDRDDWGNAIALNSVMLSSSTLLGPAVGGILIATVGVKYCFLYDSLSYIAAILTLKAMRIRPIQHASAQSHDTWQKLREGFQYVSSVQPIRSILLMLALQGLVGISYMALLPVFATDILHGNASTMATLSMAGPVGSLLACLYLSFRRDILGLERLIALSQGLIGIGLICFALSKAIWLSLPMLLVVGGFTILQISSSNTIIQTLVADDKRGRVMSFYALAMVGMMPFGNLLAGSLAQMMGAPNALMICGSICILGSVWFSSQVPLVRCWIKRETHSPQSVARG